MSDEGDDSESRTKLLLKDFADAINAATPVSKRTLESSDKNSSGLCIVLLAARGSASQIQNSAAPPSNGLLTATQKSPKETQKRRAKPQHAAARPPAVDKQWPPPPIKLAGAWIRIAGFGLARGPQLGFF
jgi:hypothetical protein